MPIEIIKPVERITRIDYSLEYDYIDSPGCGFGFTCDEDGNVLVAELPAAALANYEMCQVSTKLVCKGVRRYVSNFTDPAIGRCYCGAEVGLGDYTNTCDSCGADYDWNGTRLSPREHWGEETGESLGDILRIP